MYDASFYVHILVTPRKLWQHSCRDNNEIHLSEVDDASLQIDPKLTRSFLL